jgi:hypothetical protein
MRSPLSLALTNSTSLAILGLSIFAGLMAAWWLFPLGLLFWAISVAVIAGDKALRINYNMQAGTQTLSARFQRPYANVVRAQMRIFNLLSSSSGRTRRALEPVQQEVEALVNHAYTVCQRMTGPENFLKISQNTDFDGQRALLVLSLGGISDPLVKREKQEAIKALETRMQEIKEIGTLLDQAEASVTSLAVSIESFLSEIMSLQVRGAEQVEKEVPNLIQKIRLQTEQLKSLESQAGQHQ